MVGDIAIKSWVSSANCWWEIPWFDNILARGDIYRVKKRGPKTDPWGTPMLQGVGGEVELPRDTNCERSVRYDKIHCKTSPSIPKLVFSREMSNLWSTKSNAALRSKATRMVDFDRSEAWNILSSVNVRAVSVECFSGMPIDRDCNLEMQ